jgi:ABC-2 type transport system ATP-binding protein
MIKIEQLTKYYGNKCGINKLEFEIHDGEIFGIIGPNGAGKSTCINTMIGVLNPGSGNIFYDGICYTGKEIAVKEKLGVVPEQDFLFEYLTVDEQITYIGKIYGISGKELERRKKEFYDLFLFYKHSNKLISELSKGTRKIVAFFCAIIHKPKYLILDEPLEGLDIKHSKIIKDILMQLKETGANILISSHNLYLMEHICDRIGIIIDGEIIFSGGIDMIKARLQEALHNNESILEKYLLSIVGEEDHVGLSWITN